MTANVVGPMGTSAQTQSLVDRENKLQQIETLSLSNLFLFRIKYFIQTILYL